MLRRLDDKLRALLEAESLSGIQPDVQALTEAEGLAMRPGPRPRLDEGLLATPARSHQAPPGRGVRLRGA